MTATRIDSLSDKFVNSSETHHSLPSLPPTDEAFEQNVLRAHLQLSFWLYALEEAPPAVNTSWYGFERRQMSHVKGAYYPWMVADGVQLASPDLVRLQKM